MLVTVKKIQLFSSWKAEAKCFFLLNVTFLQKHTSFTLITFSRYKIQQKTHSQKLLPLNSTKLTRAWQASSSPNRQWCTG